MKLLGRIPSWLRNKYFLSSAIFVVFITFFDDRDLVANYHHRQQLKELERSAQYYQAEIDRTKNELSQLKNDAATLEKYAREKFFMKRDNEDVFLVKPVKRAE
jgi:cell division protein DivIC